jgi:DNA polymerase-3 subunit delta'
MADALKRLRDLPWHASAWPELQSLRARRHHAILLHGPAGVGKKGLALDFAAALLCESPRADGRACERCAGCALFETRNHPDLRIVVPDSLAWLRPEAIDEEAAAESDSEPEDGGTARVSREIRIDTVRALAGIVELATHRGGYRVILLTPAEALNGPSANALLKLLEEPRPRTQFILTADRLDEVLPTIVSRCALLRVAPPPAAVAIEWLRQSGIAEPERALAAVGGAPLLAVEDDASALSEATRRLLREALARGPQLDVVAAGARLPRAFPMGDAIDLFQRWAWDLLALRSAGRVRYHPHEQDVLERLAAGLSAADVLRWIDALKRARATAEHALNARLTIEALLSEYVACLSGAAVQRAA